VSDLFNTNAAIPRVSRQFQKGQLPFLKDGSQLVPSASIARYLSQTLGRRGDESLSDAEKAGSLAYATLAEDKLCDLVHHSFYSLPQNFLGLTRPALAASLSVPRRYFVPARLRMDVKDRLEANGLWNLGGEAEFDEERERLRRRELFEADYKKQQKKLDGEKKEDLKRKFDEQKVRVN
jgi:sorting and assembly machinery component 37